MFTLRQLELIDWLLATAVENNPDDGEIATLAEKVADLITDRLPTIPHLPLFADELAAQKAQEAASR